MGHYITGVVAKEFQFDCVYIDRIGIRLYSLNNGYKIMAFGNAELDNLNVHAIPSGVFLGKSVSGICVLIETEYFGGVGSQAATVFQSGKIITQRVEGGGGVINEALKAIGVEKGECLDEFESLGLGKYRSFSSDA